MKKLVQYISVGIQRMIRWFERRKYINSSEPWVNVIGTIDETNELRLDVDWNLAFILYLREQGIPGIRDEDVVAYWITLLNKQNLTNE